MLATYSTMYCSMLFGVVMSLFCFNTTDIAVILLFLHHHDFTCVEVFCGDTLPELCFNTPVTSLSLLSGFGSLLIFSNHIILLIFSRCYQHYSAYCDTHLVSAFQT